MKGHLHITCARDAAGQTYLREQSFCAPFHLSKPHTDAGSLVVNLVNPTAGLFDGDELDLDVRVETGARVVLTTPGAARIYQSRTGEPARVRQTVRAAPGSFLEFLPEPLIPQAGCVYSQQTTLDVAEDAELLFFEWLSPGRSARGELLQYRKLSWQTDLRITGQWALRERYHLEPSRPASIAALTSCFPAAHYLGCFWVSHRPLPTASLATLATDHEYLGWSALPHGGWVIKALGRDSLGTRNLLGRLRHILYEAMNRAAPRTGRF